MDDYLVRPASAFSTGPRPSFTRPSVSIPSPSGLTPPGGTPSYGSSNVYAPSPASGAGATYVAGSLYAANAAASPYLRPSSSSSMGSSGIYISPTAAKTAAHEQSMFKRSMPDLRDNISPISSLSPRTPRGSNAADHVAAAAAAAKPPSSPATYVSPRIGTRCSPDGSDMRSSLGTPARELSRRMSVGDIYESTFSSLEKRSPGADEEAAVLRGELKRKEEKLQEALKELQRSRHETEELQEARRQARAALSEMADQNKKLLASYTEKKEDLRRMEEASIVARGEAQTLAEERTTLAGALREAREEISRLKAQYPSDPASNDRLKCLKDECDELRMSNFRQSKEIEALNAKVEELHCALSRTSGSPRSPVDKAKMLHKNKTAKTLQIEKLSDQNTALKQENEMIKRMNEEITERAARRERASGYKQDGTVSFQRLNYSEALQHYSKAIDEEVEDPKFNALLYCNRAACHMALKDFLSCISDCCTAASLDSSLPRTYHRRAEAYQALGDYSTAYNDMIILKDRLGKGDDVCSLMESLRAKANDQTSVNHYTVLGVPCGANERDIKKAYKTLALIHHPDKVAQAEQSGAECVFKMLSDALRVLTSDDARKRFDAALGSSSSGGSNSNSSSSTA